MRSVLRWPGNFLHFLYLVVVGIVCGLIYLFGRIGTRVFNHALSR